MKHEKRDTEREGMRKGQDGTEQDKKIDHKKKKNQKIHASLTPESGYV